MPTPRRTFLLGTAAAAGLASTGLAAPALAATAAAAPDATPAVLARTGLYSYPYWNQVHEQDFRATGWQLLRMGGRLADEDVDRLNVHGWSAMPTLSPTRARSTYGSDDAFVADYVADVDAFLQRYGPGGSYHASSDARATYPPVTEIEIVNEPNFDPQLGDRWSRAALYARLLVATHRHVKQTWPEVTVVAFGAGGTSAAAPGFIEAVHRADPAVASSYDVVSFHPYVEPFAPEATRREFFGTWSIAGTIADIRGTLARAGRSDAPLWITEIGWQATQASGATYAIASGLDPYWQAAYSVRANLLAARYGVERVYHMFAVDTDGFNGGFYDEHGPRLVARAHSRYLHATAAGIVGCTVLAEGQYRLDLADGTAVVAAWSDQWRSAVIDGRWYALGAMPIYVPVDA